MSGFLEVGQGIPLQKERRKEKKGGKGTVKAATETGESQECVSTRLREFL